jgi:hypothetical protein
MSKNYKVTERSIDDYKPDPDNANRGTARGEGLIASSFLEVGPVRSVAADAHDVLLAGNQSIKGAKEAGITKVIEIETDGDALIVHKRRDLDAKEERGRRAALYDNRTTQLDLDFDPGILLSDPAMLDGLWRPEELELLFETRDAEGVVSDAVEGGGGDRVAAHRPKQVKVVLYTDEVRDFERALAVTDLVNRGDALMAVCRFFLEHHAEDHS